MTSVKVTRREGLIVKVDSIGHAGFAVEGEDIVCAGLSSILQTTLLGLIEVAGINIKYKVDEEIGRLTFALPDNLSDREIHDAQIILKTMLCGVADLQQGYSEYITLEVK